MLMPAAHKKEYHNAFPGGYVDHVLRVVDCALKLNDVWVEMGVDTSTYTKEELVFSALNHDLGKLGDSEHESYIPQTDQWLKDKLGEDYKFNDRLEYMSVPDRGLHLLMSHGIQFSKNEMLAIKLHDGLYDEANKPYLLTWMPETKPRTSLIYIVHQADLMAARIEFEHEWLPKFKSNLPNQEKNFKLESKETTAKKQSIKTKALGNIKSANLKNVMDDFFND
ncbi:MAG: hypothetical protein ACO25K_07280 [Candidatus Fonsibacter ubiquis]